MTTTDRDAEGDFVTIRDSRTEPTMSVLMPVYNQERLVEAAIGSVMAQQDIVVEILVSDDHSTDGTVAAAQHALESSACPHRLRLRQGRTRLFRDHQVRIADAARCDLLLVAHGDDIAEPQRARRVHDALADDGFVLVGSAFRVIDEALRSEPAGATKPPDEQYEVLDATSLLSHRRELIGSLVGWRESALASFPRLDSTYSACSHDVIRPFRAGLTGPVAVIHEPLVRRRVHPGSWSKRLWDQRSPDAGAFGSALYQLTALRAMANDLDVAARERLISPSQHTALAERMETTRHELWDRALTAHGELVNRGRMPLWVTEDELNLAWRGDLFSTFARNARVADALAAGRRVAHRAARRWPRSSG